MQVSIDAHNQDGDIYSKISVKKEDTSLPLYQDAIKESEVIVENIIKQNI